MQITLLRHGKPDISQDQLIQPKKFGKWLDAYNDASLCLKNVPDSDILALAKKSKTVVCSDLPRSINSALRLGVKPICTEPLFREMELPYWSFPAPALPANLWTFLFRLCWFSGLTSKAESFKDAKIRAVRATDQLVKLVQEHHQIIFVGHGLLNWFIAKTLLENGWSGPKNPGKKYWQYGVYTYATT
jgi:broad specificity phosphatase PhoE